FIAYVPYRALRFLTRIASGVPIHGVLHELCRGAQRKLALDALAMRLDGLDAQVEGFGRLTRRQALADHVQHLQLAIRQTVDRVRRNVCAARGELFDHAVADRFADVDAALEHTAQG